MKIIGTRFVACLSICILLSGCGVQETKTDDTNGQENVAQITDAADTSGTEFKVTMITEVFGDGQKPSAVAIEYPSEIDTSTLSVDDYEITGQTITEVYTNSEAAMTDSNIPGNYVILKLAYESNESANMGGGENRSRAAENGEETGFDKGGEVDGGKLRGDAGAGGGRGQGAREQTETNLSVSIIQKGEVAGIDGTVYPANETAVENSERIDLVVEDFQLLEYTDSETGATIPYSLYLPADYNESKEYPLLFFVADASANGDDFTRNLTQGNGATVWATPEEQAKHECIILSPQYTNTLIDSIGALTTDDNVWSDGLTLVSNLLHYVIEEYSVDENRIYGTGQSQGCMTNIALSDKYPDLFAAQLLVAGQWNVEEMSAMKDKNLWIIVCEGDSKAYHGMNEATENWESLGSSVARSEIWDSTSTAEQFDELVAQMESQNCKINYTVFKGGSHTYTWSVAYNIEGIRDWLFAQEKI